MSNLYPAFPLVDRANPLYCPAVPANKYLKALREKQRKNLIPARTHIAHSFLQSLLSLHGSPVQQSRCSSVHSSSPSRNSWIAPWDHPPSSNLPRKTLFGASKRTRSRHPRVHTARRRKQANAKRRDFVKHFDAQQHAKSSGSFDETSFEVVLRHEKLYYPALETIVDSSPGPALMPAAMLLDLPLPDGAAREMEDLKRQLNALEGDVPCSSTSMCRYLI